MRGTDIDTNRYFQAGLGGFGRDLALAHGNCIRIRLQFVSARFKRGSGESHPLTVVTSSVVVDPSTSVVVVVVCVLSA